MPTKSSVDHCRPIYPALPDALADALGRVAADARQEARKEYEALAAEQRAILAEMRVRNLELYNENAELRRAIRSDVDAEIGRLREAAAAIKDGRDGVDGLPGPQGEKGESGPLPDYGIVLERSEPLLRSLIAARWDDWTKTLPLPERGEKGEPGQDADPETIKQLVDEKLSDALPQILDLVPRAVATEVRRVVAELPPAERGECGPQGEPGEPGRDADMDLVARMIDERVAQIPLAKDGEPGRDGVVDYFAINGAIALEVGKAVAQLPLPEKGEIGPVGPQGEPGPAGRDGHDLDLDMLEQLVAEKVAALPVPEDILARMVDDAVAAVPRPKDGERGADGKDADPEMVAALVKQEVSKAVAEIPVPRDGQDGKNADPAEVEALVNATVIKAVAELPAPERGEPGERGERGEPGERGERGERGEPGQDADPALVKQIVETTVQKAVAAIPPAERGEPGEQGPPGDAGPPGRDGVGIAGALIDRQGSCILTLSDGAVHNLGPIVGKDGAPGERGMDGKDGLSFADFELEPEYDGERTIRLRWVNGGKEHIREWRLPIIIDRGVYRPETPYEAGDAVSFGGSIWIAKNATSEKPGEGATNWRLSVKSGRPGKDGAPGAKGDPGRPGRDWTPQGPSGGKP